MYAMKILLDMNRKAERLQRVCPFKFPKARDGGNRPRMFKTRIFNERLAQKNLDFCGKSLISNACNLSESYRKDFRLLHCLQQTRQHEANRGVLLDVPILQAVSALFRV